MNRFITTCLGLGLLANLTAFAGGFVTNTNQNVAFLRNPAQDAAISVGAAYSNPAGVGFLDRRVHLSLNWQMAKQTREVTANYAPLAFSQANPSATRWYEGKSFAPVIPSFDVAWRFDEHFFASAHLGIIGGGGKADFASSIGSIESQIAIIPALLNKLAGAPVCFYNADLNIVGEQYVYAGQINIGYRVNDHLSVSAGLRANYVSNHYTADIKRIQISGLENFPQLQPSMQQIGALLQDRELNCSQTGWGWTPILSVDYKVGAFNFAARYEFNTKVRLTNKTGIGQDAGMPQYVDGLSDIASDIPGLLTVGAQWAVIPAVRVSLGFHNFFDKQASFYNAASGQNDRQDAIEHNTREYLLGVEYDVLKKLTLSVGGQLTRFGWGDDYGFIYDQSYNINSFSLGIGLNYRINDRISIDAAFFKTFYERVDKQMADYNRTGDSTYTKLQSALGQGAAYLGLTKEALTIPGSDSLYRTNTVFGLGLNYSF